MKATFPARSSRWQTLASAVLLAAAAVLAYWPALAGGFIWDDETLVTGNDLVKSADGLRRIWFTTQPIDYWPLTNSSFWLEWRLWGMHTTGYHATNLLLHIGSAWLVWAILKRLSIPGAFLAALLFVLHPVNVESVAWIAQRKNTLSMVFFLLSILWFLKFDAGLAGREPETPPAAAKRRRGGRAVPGQPDRSRTGHWYWLSLAAFVLAMLSKGSVAILPAVLLLLVWWRRGMITRVDLMRSAPFFGVAVALTLVNIWFQMHLVPDGIRHVTLVQRALGAAAIVWFYLYKALWPAQLVFIYPQWDIRASEIRWWLPLAAALGTSAVLFWQRRRPFVRALLCAWVFFCLALLPVMGFTDVYYMTYSLVADHYQYIAIIGVVASIAAGLARLMVLAQEDVHLEGKLAAWLSVLGRGLGFGRPLGAGAWCAAILMVLGTGTWRQSHQYVNAETIYRSTLRDNPSSWLAHNQLGVLLVARSVDDEAMLHFRDAIRLKPDLITAHNNLCHALQQAGRAEEAVAECSKALQLDSDLSTAHNDLGASLASLGQFDRAQAEFEAALRLDQNYGDAHNNLANILVAKGQEAQAAEHYRQAVRIMPDFAAGRANFGFALEKLGRTDEAIDQYREAIRLDPSLGQIQRRLAALLQESGRMEAVARYTEALRLHPDQPGLHLDLANAWLEAGRSEKAVEEYTLALASRPDSAAAHNGLASALEDLGRSSEAERHFREAIRLQPDFAPAHQNLGDLLEGLKRLDEAAAEYTEALRYDPRSAETHNNLGVVLVRLGRTDEAVNHFRTALALQPDYADARNNLTRVLAPHPQK